MANSTETCTVCGKKFRIIEQEQKFLDEKGWPMPTMCPACRQTRRLHLRGTRQLYKTKCDKCGKEILVSYDPKKFSNPIFCKKDYNQYWEETDPIITDPLPDD